MISPMYVFNVFTFLNETTPRCKDIVGDVPAEIGCHILRMLDVDSLINAVLVSPRWRNLILHDPVACGKISNYLHEIRRTQKENRKVDGRYRTVRSTYIKFFMSEPSVRCLKRKRTDETPIASKKRTMRF